MEKRQKRKSNKALLFPHDDSRSLSKPGNQMSFDYPLNETRKGRKRPAEMDATSHGSTLVSEQLASTICKASTIKKRKTDKVKPSMLPPSKRKKMACPDFDPSADSDTGSKLSELDKSSIRDRSTQRAHRAANREKLRRTLFVGNLPMGITRKELKRLFNHALKQNAKSSKAGCQVESVRFRGVVAPTGGTGRLAKKRAAMLNESSAAVSRNLIAYVVLTSPVGMSAAMALNGHLLQAEKVVVDLLEEGISDSRPVGKPTHIRVDHAGGEGRLFPAQCVFLGNLPFDVQEDEVREAMSGFGQISNVRLVRDRLTGAVKGFGFVQFVDPSVVSLAIRASGTVSIRNRSIRIEQWQAGPSKQSEGTRHYTQKSHKRPHQPRLRTDRKSYPKLQLTGQVKGVTLPSNLRGAQRQRFLQKRLIKKQKRVRSRQQKVSANHTTKSN